MESHTSEAAVQTAFEEKKTENESTREPLNKPFAKDDYSGDRIKDLADKGGLIASVGSLIIGVVLWTRSTDIGGLVTGLVVTAVGITISIIMTRVVRSYGDMLNMTVEQTKIIKKLEERKAAELAFWGAPKQKDGADAQEHDEAPQELSKEGGGSREGDEEPVPEVPPPNTDGKNDTAAKPGIVVDRVNKTVRYPQPRRHG